MVYVEYLRVRRALSTYAIVVIAIATVMTASLLSAHIYLNDREVTMHNVVPPLTVVLVTALFGSLIFGTLMAGSLNRERETRPLSWTRPATRERLALSCMSIDFCGIAAAGLVTLAAGSIPLFAIGILSRIRPDGHAAAGVALTLGMTVMWYGLVQAATSWSRVGAGLAIGLSWVIFPMLVGVGHASIFGPIFAGAVTGLNYLNPLAYASSYNSSGAGMQATSYLPLGEGARIVATWAIGLAACAIAIFAWKRSEA